MFTTIKINEKITYWKENNDNKSFVCQCIVNTGSNNDSAKKNGISHLIEHFLIHESKYNSFFKDVKIHGVTGFYYTCYYWYVYSQAEAICSFYEFEKVLHEIGQDKYNEKIFVDTKKEIEEEIIFYADKNDKISKVTSALSNDKNVIQLPIGTVEDVRTIEYKDIKDYINMYYSFSNIEKYLLDRKNKIYIVINSEIKEMQIPMSQIQRNTYMSKKKRDNYKSVNIKILTFNQSLEENSVKIIFKNRFIHSIAEIIIGEIFLIQICDYLKKTMGNSTNIAYDKIFISKNQIYFALTIYDLNQNKYKKFIQKRELEIYDLLQNILEEEGFIRILYSVIHYLEKYDCTMVEEEELRIDLINYSTLLYGSYNITDCKEYILSFLSGFRYKRYYEYILDKIMTDYEESIKILY